MIRINVEVGKCADGEVADETEPAADKQARCSGQQSRCSLGRHAESRILDRHGAIKNVCKHTFHNLHSRRYQKQKHLE